jgi:hypothetical protein
LLNSVDFPTFGRPMIATSGIGASDVKGSAFAVVAESRFCFMGRGGPYHRDFHKDNLLVFSLHLRYTFLHDTVLSTQCSALARLGPD